MSIGLPQGERQKLERTLHSTNDLPLAFFKPAQVSVKINDWNWKLIDDHYRRLMVVLLTSWIFELSSIRQILWINQGFFLTFEQMLAPKI